MIGGAIFSGNWLFDLVWAIGMCWTWVDSRRRLGRTVGRLAIALLGVVPILGPLLYALLRPAETVRERRERARRRRLMEQLAAARQGASASAQYVAAEAPAGSPHRPAPTARPRRLTASSAGGGNSVTA